MGRLCVWLGAWCCMPQLRCRAAAAVPAAAAMCRICRRSSANVAPLLPGSAAPCCACCPRRRRRWHAAAPTPGSPPGPRPAAAESTSQDWEAWEGINVADLDDQSEVGAARWVQAWWVHTPVRFQPACWCCAQRRSPGLQGAAAAQLGQPPSAAPAPCAAADRAPASAAPPPTAPRWPSCVRRSLSGGACGRGGAAKCETSTCAPSWTPR